MKAHTELLVLRLDREDFEKMLKEFPEIKTATLEKANIRKFYS